jgi:hypothetical protein
VSGARGEALAQPRATLGVCAPGSLAALESEVTTLVLKPGTVLFRESDASDAMYVVLLSF